MSLRATVAASLTALTLPLIAAATSTPARALAVDENPRLTQRVLNMAHSGGEREAPTNTMYAFKRAVKVGSDMIELDVQSTKDKLLVVLHNSTLDETTNGTGRVVTQTWRAVKKLDAAYWFVPGKGTTHDARKAAYKLRRRATATAGSRATSPPTSGSRCCPRCSRSSRRCRSTSRSRARPTRTRRPSSGRVDCSPRCSTTRVAPT
ncbi:glycerophosphodiester phosphodiesterase family protein [Nocardioides sp. B-3]|uniref:glycerophosphodiester phosphodiesterase family protein n=1 Tax=Nocardioides sp. B-3 TaxID=2895565 RepID=UPI002152750B|nr:glycerophosphodiester phosphodiesterase family protein [Nocardioides sp. B-3]UUZ61331.1 hypothetical protein LP418_12535 [Nocardioides sp. B-3]